LKHALGCVGLLVAYVLAMAFLMLVGVMIAAPEFFMF
jgi:hypothetical protein